MMWVYDELRDEHYKLDISFDDTVNVLFDDALEKFHDEVVPKFDPTEYENSTEVCMMKYGVIKNHMIYTEGGKEYEEYLYKDGSVIYERRHNGVYYHVEIIMQVERLDDDEWYEKFDIEDVWIFTIKFSGYKEDDGTKPISMNIRYKVGEYRKV